MRALTPLLLASLLLACSSSPGRDAGGDLGSLDRGEPSELGPVLPDWPPAPDGLPVGLPLKADPPASVQKLVFIHHSVGEDIMRPDRGNLRAQLNAQSYFLTDTNYDWGPADADSGDGKIGDHTDIGHWSRWFLGPNRDTYQNALYQNSHLTQVIEANSIGDPGGENSIVLFKSCFLSTDLIYGNPTDAPAPPGAANPLHGKDSSDDLYYTVANIKGLYRDLLATFANRQDKLFILLTTPPSRQADTSVKDATNLRAIHTWLVRSWLEKYPYRNVAVFDLSNVLTSNGGSPDQNDVGAAGGSHHRLRNGVVEHLTGPSPFLAYPTEDSHPTGAGCAKAATELLPLLNVAYHCWKGTGGCPRLMGKP